MLSPFDGALDDSAFVVTPDPNVPDLLGALMQRLARLRRRTTTWCLRQWEGFRDDGLYIIGDCIREAIEDATGATAEIEALQARIEEQNQQLVTAVQRMQAAEENEEAARELLLEMELDLCRDERRIKALVRKNSRYRLELRRYRQLRRCDELAARAYGVRSSPVSAPMTNHALN